MTPFLQLLKSHILRYKEEIITRNFEWDCFYTNNYLQYFHWILINIPKSTKFFFPIFCFPFLGNSYLSKRKRISSCKRSPCVPVLEQCSGHNGLCDEVSWQDHSPQLPSLHDRSGNDLGRGKTRGDNKCWGWGVLSLRRGFTEQRGTEWGKFHLQLEC